MLEKKSSEQQDYQERNSRHPERKEFQGRWKTRESSKCHGKSTMWNVANKTLAFLKRCHLEEGWW